MRYTLVWIVMVVLEDLKMSQFDMRIEFLYGDLTEEIYVKQVGGSSKPMTTFADALKRPLVKSSDIQQLNKAKEREAEWYGINESYSRFLLFRN